MGDYIYRAWFRHADNTQYSMLFKPPGSLVEAAEGVLPKLKAYCREGNSVFVWCQKCFGVWGPMRKVGEQCPRCCRQDAQDFQREKKS